MPGQPVNPPKKTAGAFWPRPSDILLGHRPVAALVLRTDQKPEELIPVGRRHGVTWKSSAVRGPRAEQIRSLQESSRLPVEHDVRAGVRDADCLWTGYDGAVVEALHLSGGERLS